MTTPSGPYGPYGPSEPDAQPTVPAEQYPPQQPYPPYGAQPPYPPYPYGAAPGMPPMTPVMAPPAPQRSNRTLWIVLSVVGGVLLLACIGCGALVFTIGRFAQGPVVQSAGTLGVFCAFEEQQDYANAYGLLSPDLQSRESESAFTQANTQQDGAQGTIRTCQVAQGSQPQITSTTAMMQIEVTRVNSSGPVSGVVSLVNNGNGWKIDDIDSSLGLL